MPVDTIVGTSMFYGSFILPTGECFNDAMEIIERLVKDDARRARSDEFKLVHAVCQFPDGELFAHAWVERSIKNDTFVIFCGIYNNEKCYFHADRQEFYDDAHVLWGTRYTIYELWQENKKSGHYGPWKEEYRALTRQGKGAPK